MLKCFPIGFLSKCPNEFQFLKIRLLQDFLSSNILAAQNRCQVSADNNSRYVCPNWRGLRGEKDTGGGAEPLEIDHTTSNLSIYPSLLYHGTI